MATAVAKYLITQSHARRTTVRIDKPSALLLAQAASVEITRDRSHFAVAAADDSASGTPARLSNELLLPTAVAAVEAAPTTAASAAPGAWMASMAAPPVGSPASAPVASPLGVARTRLTPLRNGRHCAYIALGSNLGDRAGHLARALAALAAEDGCTVVDTAFLYETPAAYVTDQPAFLNSACTVYTDLSPRALLQALKRIEVALGRTPTLRYGPRVVDLDILFYDDVELSEPDLIIPHALLHEREFVLRPLCDIAPSHEHPGLQKTVEHLLLHLKDHGPVWRVLPVGNGTVWRWGERTRVMGIVNASPDSFSDVGRFADAEAAAAHALQLVADGADIIDVGGMSSRPHAPDVSPDAEAARVVEVIRRIRAAGVAGASVPISVDTFRASVARQALEAGATFINDISGGTRDPEMLNVMAHAGVPVCLMHMRGDAATMTTVAAKTYATGGGASSSANAVVAGVCHELGARVQDALAAGVYRWNIVVDPGLGFAKQPEQSLDLVRNLRGLVGPGTELAGFPTLVGPSRKGFVGAVVHRDVDGRAWGTAATCAALVAAGVDIVRVHDVREMADVVRMADAIWRARP